MPGSMVAIRSAVRCALPAPGLSATARASEARAAQAITGQQLQARQQHQALVQHGIYFGAVRAHEFSVGAPQPLGHGHAACELRGLRYAREAVRALMAAVDGHVGVDQQRAALM